MFFLVAKVITDHHRKEGVAIVGGIEWSLCGWGIAMVKKSKVITISMGRRLAVLSGWRWTRWDEKDKMYFRPASPTFTCLPVCAQHTSSFTFYIKPYFGDFAYLRRSSWWWWACPRRASPCPPPGWSPAPSPPSSGSPWWVHRAARQQTSGLKQGRFIKGSISRDFFGGSLPQEESLAWV